VEEVVTSSVVGLELVKELLCIADGIELPSADVVCDLLEMLEVGIVVDIPGLEPAPVEDSPEGLMGRELVEVVASEVAGLKLLTALLDAVEGPGLPSRDVVRVGSEMLEAAVVTAEL
jgi:hypothetical protein